jgi:hypothetical protein
MTTLREIRVSPAGASAGTQRFLVDWIERVVLCLAVIFLCLHSLPRAWRSLNTDFPNYYIAAQLARQGYDTSRMYEWSWIEREKDHRNIDNRVIGLLPITPFSTLAVWPLTQLAPLKAKHVWILLNLAALVPIGWMLSLMTGLSVRRVALTLLLSFPLYRNLLYGQFYVVLLLLITAACFSYLRGYRSLAAALVAIAGVCKIFPLLLFIFFLQRRQWRALATGIFTLLVAVSLSISVFGLNAHRTWLHEILPWVMRGEALGTYATNASISGVLHCLFLFEPDWNPHPWHSSPLLYSLLAPILQTLILAPAILLIRRTDTSPTRLLVEWSALITASLAVSPTPASYNFVLMVFPVCVLASILLRTRRYAWLCALVVAYLGIGFPLPVPQRLSGLTLLLYVPRLPLMLAVLLGVYGLLWRDGRASRTTQSCDAHDWTQYAWAGTLLASLLAAIPTTLHVERAVREEYAFRLPLRSQDFFSATPQPSQDGLYYTTFALSGYHLVAQGQNQPLSTDADPVDDLSSSSSSGHLLVERASAPRSRILDLRNLSDTVVDNARNPMLSSDGKDLAFVRDDLGRGRLILRRSFRSSTAELALTSASVNVYEASFLSPEVYAFSATQNGGAPAIFLTDATHRNMPLGLASARYPALSADGRWLAYSHLDHGVWNLWLRDQGTGHVRRIADLPCNQIHPIWENDSKTLVYATDCGRSLWFTALARREVIP